MTSVKSEYGICCPKCGNDTELDIEITTTARLMPNGTDIFEGFDGSHEWDDKSRCWCHACNWEGVVADAKVEEQK